MTRPGVNGVLRHAAEVAYGAGVQQRLIKRERTVSHPVTISRRLAHVPPLRVCAVR